MKNMTVAKLVGIEPEQIWKGDYILVLPAGLVLITKRVGKRGYSVATFERGSGSSHTGADSLAKAVKEAKKQARAYQDARINRSNVKHAIRTLADTL
jgi:hypothetical protein